MELAELAVAQRHPPVSVHYQRRGWRGHTHSRESADDACPRSRRDILRLPREWVGEALPGGRQLPGTFLVDTLDSIDQTEGLAEIVHRLTGLHVRGAGTVPAGELRIHVVAPSGTRYLWHAVRVGLSRIWVYAVSMYLQFSTLPGIGGRGDLECVCVSTAFW